MYSGYWDDYFEVGKTKKDCIYNVWRISIGLEKIKGKRILTTLYKKTTQCTKKEASITPISDKIALLKQKGYQIEKGVWNESKKTFVKEYSIV